MDDSWRVCQYVWITDKASRGDEVHPDSCEGAISKECYDAMRRKLGTRGPNGSCQSVVAANECKESFGIGEKGDDYAGYGLGGELPLF